MEHCKFCLGHESDLQGVREGHLAGLGEIRRVKNGLDSQPSEQVALTHKSSLSPCHSTPGSQLCHFYGNSVLIATVSDGRPGMCGGSRWDVSWVDDQVELAGGRR